jgi:alpha-tubulin suppressor-like RCC1 family protein
VRSIETVKNHTCAVRTDDPTLVCWGSNQYLEHGGIIVGKLGPAAAGLDYTRFPVPVKFKAKVIDVGMAYESTYAVTADGLIYGWGFNGSGQLGTGRTDDHIETPTRVMVSPGQPLIGATSVLRSDGSDQCAHLQEGNSTSRYVCWGSDEFGELGFGLPAASTPFAQPTSVIPGSGTQLVRGESHGCFTASEEGRVAIWCYGQDPFVANGADEGEQAESKPIQWDSSTPPPTADSPDDD